MTPGFKKYLLEVFLVFGLTFVIALYGWSNVSERNVIRSSVNKQNQLIAAAVVPPPNLEVVPTSEERNLSNITPGPVYVEARESESVVEDLGNDGVDSSSNWTIDRNRIKRNDKDILYIEVTGSCGPYHEGECVRVRSGPGTDYPVVSRVRNGMVLRVGEVVEADGYTWYEIVFDEWLRYPERVSGKQYLAGDFVAEIYDAGPLELSDVPVEERETNKKIVVSRNEQKLYGYEGDELVMEINVSTGLEMSPTPRGTFRVYKKTPSRYMQGPLPYIAGSDYYDLPGVPWNLYFTDMGAVVHGAYWHDAFGSQYSHGCVNVDPDVAYDVYQWADLGTTVVVRD